LRRIRTTPDYARPGWSDTFVTPSNPFLAAFIAVSLHQPNPVRAARAPIVAAIVATLSVTACESTGLRNRDAAACPQTGEFANYGCAKLAVVLTTSTGVPASRLVLGSAVLDSATGGEPNGLNSDFIDAQGRTGLQWTWYVAPPARDTVRMRIRVIRPGNIGIPPQPLDSIDVAVVFARVGTRPPTDTLRWQLP
jgi:hypothetical protein